jgi:plasmid maintenance system antidote protein VapI
MERFMRKKLRSLHPGEILLEEFLKPLGLSDLDVASEELGERLEHEVKRYAKAG